MQISEAESKRNKKGILRDFYPVTMLCVRKITFVDRAEPEPLWTSKLKKQWCFGDLVAVRVQDFNERVLGSTIPLPFVSAQEGETTWGVSWIDEDPVEQPVQPDESDTTAAFSAAPQEVLGTGEERKPSAALPQDVAAANAVSPQDDTNTSEDPEALQPPSTQQNADEPPLPAAAPAVVPENDAAAPEPSNTAVLAVDGDAPPTTAAEKVAEEAAEQKGVGKAADAQLIDGSVGFSATAGPETLTAEAAANAAAHPPSSAASSLPIVPQQPSNAVPRESRRTPASSPVLPQPADRRSSFSNCLPIDITQAAKGPLFLDVITASGTKLAVTEANVQAILREDVSGSLLVRHYAVMLTPLKAKPDGTVYAVLEFSVVVGSADSDTVVSLAASARYSALPTSLEVSNACAFSTRTFYFPPKFLTGTGEYIVTNVLCVESRSDNAVRLEVALPEDLRRMGVLPDKRAVLNRRGERTYFTFTWNVLDPYVNLEASTGNDADDKTVGLHILIRDGAENQAPVDIELVGDNPSPVAELTEPFLFYVNHARMSNVAFGATDEAILAEILPISLVTRAGV
jgi:hypothetical protein